MGILDRLRGSAQQLVRGFTADRTFLTAAAAAVATVTYADGTAEESEKEASLASLMGQAVISQGFEARAVNEAYNRALNNASNRAGKQTNLYAIAEVRSRPVKEREMVLLMAADVGDVDKAAGHAAHGIGADEYNALLQIAKQLDLKLDDYGIGRAA